MNGRKGPPESLAARASAGTMVAANGQAVEGSGTMVCDGVTIGGDGYVRERYDKLQRWMDQRVVNLGFNF